MKRIAVIIMAFFCFCASNVFASATDIKFSGYTWFRYTTLAQHFSDGGFDTNKMSVERAYLKWKLKYQDNMEGNLTLDIPMKPGNTANSDWTTIIKYAYVDVKQILPESGFLRIGVQPVYFSMIDKWEYPLIEKSVEDVNGFLSSADLGISFQGNLPWGIGDYQLAGFNGNGYAKASETDRNVATDVSMTLKPLAGLSFRGSLYSSNVSSGDAYDREGVYAEKYYQGYSLNYNLNPFWIMGEVITGKKPNSLCSDYTNIYANSILLQYTVNDAIDLLARQDIYDPDLDSIDSNRSDTKQTRTIYGINYKWMKDLLVQLDFEELLFTDGPDTSATPTTSRSVDDYVMLQLKWSY